MYVIMTHLTILIISGLVNNKHQKGSYMHNSIIINSNINTMEHDGSFGCVKINSIAIKNKI